MGKVVKFSFDSDSQKQEFDAYAKAHGETLSSFVKRACYAARTRSREGSHHPVKDRGALARPASGANSDRGLNRDS